MCAWVVVSYSWSLMYLEQTIFIAIVVMVYSGSVIQQPVLSNSTLQMAHTQKSNLFGVHICVSPSLCITHQLPPAP